MTDSPLPAKPSFTPASVSLGRARRCGVVLAAAAASCLSGIAFAQTSAPPAKPASSAKAPSTTTDQTIEAAVAKANAAIDRIVAVPDGQRTYENTLGALDDLTADFEFSVSMLVFMSNVHPDAGIRAQSQAAEEAYTNFVIDLGKREDLYQAVLAYAKTNPSLSGERKRLLEFTVRDYRRAGMNLPPEKLAHLTELQKEIGKLGIEFMKNIAEDESTVYLRAEELAGMPGEFLAGLPRAGDTYLLGLSSPVYSAVQENCEVESTREKVWLAYKRRAGKKNIAVLETALRLRAQAATLLGYANEAEYQTEIRMAKNVKAVQAFYDQLRPLVRKKARQDFAEFTLAKASITGTENAQLRPWDFMYIKSEMMKSKYAVDSEKVREYFPLSAVMDGLFSITQSLYGLEYKDVTATKAGTPQRPLWHQDVKLYEVYDKASGKMLGEFYLDLHPRESKYTHAAQWGLVQRKVFTDGRVATPLAALVCNFTKPAEGKPSLLLHEEVETFFHEFGHCLHTIVSEAELFRFAGTSVELDFVEAPSQMFENWVWDEKVLATFARHYKTGEPLPADLLSGMIKARNLGSGLDAENQFYYGLTDLAYETTSDGAVDTTKVATDLYPSVTMYDFKPQGTYFQASFGHLFNYAAGYYGYMWSLVYASDMFQRFKELGMLNPEAGMYYRQKIISRGGTHDAMDLVKDYLGREPKLESFLEHLGLEKE